VRGRIRNSKELTVRAAVSNTTPERLRRRSVCVVDERAPASREKRACAPGRRPEREGLHRFLLSAGGSAPPSSI
jgi:hypothetical protein